MMVSVKVKKHNRDGVVRLESGGGVREVMINEDFLHPNQQSISVCFAGKNSSGIIDFSPEEIDIILKAVHKRNHLLKGIRIIKD